MNSVEPDARPSEKFLSAILQIGHDGVSVELVLRQVGLIP